MEKPWGCELIWAHTESYAGKILQVLAGESLSLHFHRFKDETLYVLSGAVELELRLSSGASGVLHLEQGQSLRLVPGTVHRICALQDSSLLEVSSPELDDVVRLSDRYGRLP